VIGMRLAEGDEVISLGAASRGEEMISVTQQGYGKRTPLKDYPRKGRGGKGVVGHKLTKKTGQLAGAFVGSKDQDVFVISSSGIVIRVQAGEIRRVGRASQGVRTMRVEEGAHVVALAPVITQMDEPEKVEAASEVEAGKPAATPAPAPAPAPRLGETAAPEARRAAAKKSSARSSTAKKTTAKRTSAKKPVTKSGATKKTATRKATAAKKTVKKTAAKRSAATKKAAAKQTSARKATGRGGTSRTASRRRRS
jgi:DNA gyrase/topoisomerase IV subunit A